MSTVCTVTTFSESLKEMREVEVQRVETLISYMHSKILEHDWHAVADAAMDIREHEASANTITAVLRYLEKKL